MFIQRITNAKTFKFAACQSLKKDNSNCHYINTSIARINTSELFELWPIKNPQLSELLCLNMISKDWSSNIINKLDTLTKLI